MNVLFILSSQYQDKPKAPTLAFLLPHWYMGYTCHEIQRLLPVSLSRRVGYHIVPMLQQGLGFPGRVAYFNNGSAVNKMITRKYNLLSAFHSSMEKQKTMQHAQRSPPLPHIIS